MASSQDISNAVEYMLHSTDETVRKTYAEQLERWQNTREAWSMSDHFLHDRQCKMEVHYFAAQTLRRKVTPLCSTTFSARFHTKNDCDN
jgi:Importin-beta N-terminal domain